MIVAAFDPGGTTGIALRMGDPPGPLAYWTYAANKKEDVYEIFRSHKVDKVIIEQFYTGGHISRDGIWTTELVGGLEAVRYVLGIEVFRHPPQRRKSFIADAKAILKGQARFFVEHEMDALAHLLAWEHYTEGTRPK